MPGSIDKHLKARHGLNWSQYLDWFRKEQIDSASVHHQDGLDMKTDRHGEKTVVESPLLNLMKQTVKKSKPLNIRDKSNKYCSYCEISFPSRMLFLSHCQQIHKLRFKSKSGGPIEFNQSGLNPAQALALQSPTPPTPAIPITPLALPPTPPSSSTHQQALSSQPGKMSSTKIRRGEGTVPCQFCNKMFSSGSNKERHVRLSCQGAPNDGQEVNEVRDDEPMEDVEDGKGFKCNRCGRLFSKLGNLNRHYIYTCNDPPSQ